MTSRLLALLGAYVLGAVPFGFIVVKLVAGRDVRGSGSGSTGATNVTRSAGLKAGLLTYVLDVAKGAGAVALMLWIAPDPWWLGGAAVAAVLGHMFPVFLGFKGGKGVATGVGAYLLMVPLAVVSALVVWAVLFKKTRMVSLASIVATSLVPVFVFVWFGVTGHPAEPLATAGSVALGCALVVAKHHANIGRLLRGTESRFDRGRGSKNGSSDGQVVAHADEGG
jgi:acyl phosphate:glycerol-3-phosphate acyltransferase